MPDDLPDAAGGTGVVEVAAPPIDPSSDAPRPRRRGRRPAGENTRETIVAAARTLFLEQGYDRVSMRAIARRAGVDPALVHHYFDGKTELFAVSVITRSVNPAKALGRLGSVERQHLGREIITTFLDIWDTPDARGAFVSILQIAMSPDHGIRPIREFLVGEILSRFPVRCEDPAEAERRKELVVAQVLGMAMGRYVIGLPHLATASRDEIIERVGPTIQRYLDGE